MMQRLRPGMIDADGLADGTYALAVAAGKVTGLTPAPASSGGTGSASLTQAGRTTVGASWSTLVNNRVIAKKITVSAPSVLLSVAAYLRNNGSTSVDGFNVSLSAQHPTDPARTGVLLAANQLRVQGLYFNPAAEERWFALPLGYVVQPGTYWIGVAVQGDDTIGTQIAYDVATGVDVRYDTGLSTRTFFADGQYLTHADAGGNFSILANVLTV